MSEIFAPGAVGTAGPAGPPATFLGAYNSGTTYTIGQAVSSGGSSYVSLTNGNVGNTPAASPTQWGLLAAAGTGGGATVATLTSLESSLRPAPVNLLNWAAVKQNYITQVDGSIEYFAPGTVGGGPGYATNMLFCPGATQLLCNSDAGDTGFNGACYIQLFDANGTFLSNLGNVAGGYQIHAGTLITLPGTQVYARMTLANFGNFQGANTMVVVGTTAAPATMPSAFVSFAPDVSSVTQAKIGASFNAGIVGFSQSVINPSVNLLNWAAAAKDYKTASDGTLVSEPGAGGGPDYATNFMHCPGATQIVSNWAIFNDGTGRMVQLFDSLLNFIGLATNASSGYYTAGGIPITLPGTQTYVRLTFASTAAGYPGNINKAMVCAGSTLPAEYAPFVGIPTNTTVRKASELGAYLDANIITGLTSTGYAPHDDTAVVNAFLATASATNPIKLILDGVVSTTGLILSPNGFTTIEGIGWESGIIVRAGSNQDGICIGGYGAGVPWVNGEGAYNVTLPSRTATNIVLRDFTVNGGSAANYSGGPYLVPANTPVTGAPAHNIHGILLANCSGALIDNVQVIEPPNSSLKLANCDRITVRGFRDNAASLPHDCLHIDGPAEDIHVSDCTFEGLDDGIALNGPEGYGGDISRVTVSNCVFLGCDTLMRVYTSISSLSGEDHKAREIVVTNCSGNVKLCVLSLGYSPTSTRDQIEDLLISNCDMVVTGDGGTTYGWAFLASPIGLLQIRGCVYRAPTVAGIPFVLSAGASAGHVLVSDCTILRNGDGNSSPAVFVSSGTVGKFTLAGFRVVDEIGSSYTAIPAALSIPSAMAELVIHSLDMDHITALFDSNGTANVTLAKGAGLLGTGTQIADSVMDNNALYLSSNASGAPSIKVGGTAKRITLA